MTDNVTRLCDAAVRIEFAWSVQRLYWRAATGKINLIPRTEDASRTDSGTEIHSRDERRSSYGLRRTTWPKRRWKSLPNGFHAEIFTRTDVRHDV